MRECSLALAAVQFPRFIVPFGLVDCPTFRAYPGYSTAYADYWERVCPQVCLRGRCHRWYPISRVAWALGLGRECLIVRYPHSTTILVLVRIFPQIMLDNDYHIK